MGYNVHSPIKKIWIPLDYDWLTSEVYHGNPISFDVFKTKYQEKYGIDFSELIYLDEATHQIQVKGYLNTYSADDYLSKGVITKQPVFIESSWDRNNTNAETDILVYNSKINLVVNEGFGIVFKIDKSEEFTKDNLKVAIFES